MADVSFDCEVVIHPCPKGLTAHKMQRALRATAEVPGGDGTRPRFHDIEGMPSLSMKDGMTIAFALAARPPAGSIDSAVTRALSIVRLAAESEGFADVPAAFVSVELFD